MEMNNVLLLSVTATCITQTGFSSEWSVSTLAQQSSAIVNTKGP